MACVSLRRHVSVCLCVWRYGLCYVPHFLSRSLSLFLLSFFAQLLSRALSLSVSNLNAILFFSRLFPVLFSLPNFASLVSAAVYIAAEHSSAFRYGTLANHRFVLPPLSSLAPSPAPVADQPCGTSPFYRQLNLAVRLLQGERSGAGRRVRDVSRSYHSENRALDILDDDNVSHGRKPAQQTNNGREWVQRSMVRRTRSRRRRAAAAG